MGNLKQGADGYKPSGRTIEVNGKLSTECHCNIMHTFLNHRIRSVFSQKGGHMRVMNKLRMMPLCKINGIIPGQEENR